MRQIQDAFGVTNFTAGAAKKLVKVKGVMSTPNSRSGSKLSTEILDMVREFYTLDKISRLMHGKRDCASVSVEGNRIAVQKQLILCNLKEAYQVFKEENGVHLGFSKFASLRPKQVVLPVTSGTHSVCVCTIHQKVILMMKGSKILSFPECCSLVGEDFIGKVTYSYFIAKSICNPAQVECYYGECSVCRDTGDLQMFICAPVWYRDS